MSRLMQLLIVGAVGFLLIFGPLVFGVYTRHSAIKELEGKIAATRQQTAGLQSAVAKREVRERFYNDIEKVFSDLVEILPLYSPTQAESIWNALTAYRSLANLNLKTLRWTETEKAAGGAAAGKRGAAASGFEQISLDLSLSGKFFDFLRFLREVERHPSFLRVDTITLTPTKNKGEEDSEFNITMTLTTFHYVVR